MAQTTCDLLVERLTDWGVDTVFGLPGDGINGFMESLRRAQDRIRFIHVRHEEAGALAACAYAKFTGKLGVCMSTAGPGAVHLLNGLYDAKCDQAPVLAITGMPYHDLIGTNYLQDINQDYLFDNVALYNQRVMGPAHVSNLADQACRTALGRRGPTHLCIPIDVQHKEVSAGQRSHRNIKGHTASSFQAPARAPEKAEVERAAHALKGRRKVAILAGAGARGAGKELEALAEKLGAPIIKALLGKDCVPDDNPFCTGGTGVVGTRPSQEALKGCDALIIVGSSMPYVEFYPKPGQAAGIQIDMDPGRIGLRYPVEVGLVGDAKATLQALLPLLPRNDDRTFLHKIQASTREWWALMEERGTRTELPMKPQVVSWHLAQALADDAIITGDSGTVTTWVARMKLRARQRFSFSGTMCSMAAAIPYAIGAQVAYPGRQVVAFTGDGSATMLMGDLATIAQYRLPIKIVVIKNNVLGLIKWEQMVFLGNPQYGVELAPVDFVKVAEGCGLRAIHVEDPTRCGEQLQEALRLDGPALIECLVDANEPPLPPVITKPQAQHLATALARGETNRTRIGLTIGRDALDESTFEASPFGVVSRVVDRATGLVDHGARNGTKDNAKDNPKDNANSDQPAAPEPATR